MQQFIFSTITKDELSNEIAQMVTQQILKNLPQHREEELLTCRQVEEYFDISHQTRIDWTNQGILPKAVKMGSRTYYRASEIHNAPTETDIISSPQKRRA